MAKRVISVRVDQATLDRLAKHNESRRRIGYDALTLGSILDDAVQLWIDADRVRLVSSAQQVIDEMAGD